MGITYNPPATLEKFMLSNAYGRLIAGPVGSGKTHGCIMEFLRRAFEQRPGLDGRRHTRFAVIRQTMPQLRGTILKDMLKQYNKVGGHYKITDSVVEIKNSEIDCEIMLVPMEEVKDQQRLLSSQLTAAWLSECIEINVELLGPIMGRIGRYPNGDDGAPTWKGLIADTNFPLEGSDWFDFMENPPPDWEVLKQPGGLSLRAENLNWLDQTEETLALDEMDPIRFEQGRNYYLRLAANSSQEYITRYVNAEYGTDPSGMAVFRESFKRNLHVVDSLEPVSGRMLVVGQDFGRNPWSLICQFDHTGKLLILEEVPGEGIGLNLHITRNLRPAVMQDRYRSKPICVVGDPTGRNRSTLFEINEFDLLQRAGFGWMAAPTNDLDPRLRAVENMLLGGYKSAPKILIDGSRCKKLVQALAGGYRFALTKAGVGKPSPDKNTFSHVADALQYVCLLVDSPGAYAMALGRAMGANRSHARRPAPSAMAWT